MSKMLKKMTTMRKVTKAKISLMLCLMMLLSMTGLSDLWSIVGITAQVYAYGSYGGSGANGYDYPLTSIPTEEGTITYYMEDGELHIDGKGSIPNGQFMYWTTIRSVIIGKDITGIEGSAFSNCSSLERVTFEAGSRLRYIGGWAFYYSGKLCDITLPSSVEEINDGAFYACSGLKSFILPGSVKKLGSSIFSGSGLEDFRFGEGFSLKTLPGYFLNSTSIRSITIPTCVEGFGDGVFGNCGSLESVTFESGSRLKSLGDSCFSGCSKLKNITLPQGLNQINSYAFQYCTELNRLDVPTSVISIGTYAFKDSGLEEISIPVGIKTIEDGAYSSCINLKSVTIPSNIETIGDRAFYDCESLESVTIPGTVEIIENEAFLNCVKLSNISISEGVRLIGSRAFDCSGELKVVRDEIQLPSSLIFIGANAIYVNGNSNAPSILTISCQSAAKKQEGDNPYPWLRVANDSSDSYRVIEHRFNSLTESDGTTHQGTCSVCEKEITENHVFDRIDGKCACGYGITITEGNLFSGICGDKISYEMQSVGGSDYKLIITGSGDMYDYDYTESNRPGWYKAYKDASSSIRITTVILKGGITHIGNYAFDGVGSIHTVDGLYGVKTIGDYAFSGCCLKTSSASPGFEQKFTIPATVTSIGVGAFSKYNNNTYRLYISAENIEIKDSAFEKSGVSEITMYNNVRLIGKNAFKGCPYLGQVSSEFYISEIGDGAFADCPSSSQFAFNKGVGRIGSKAFADRIGESTPKKKLIFQKISEAASDAFADCTPSYFSALCNLDPAKHGLTIDQDKLNLKHEYEVIYGKYSTCLEDGYDSYSYCKLCHKYYSGYEYSGYVEIPDLEAWKKGDGKYEKYDHRILPVLGKASSCDRDGYQAYYRCTSCSTCFEDAEATRMIENLAVWKNGPGRIAALPHTMKKTEGVAATCTTDGLKDYYQCSVCKNYYEDADGNTKIVDISVWKSGAGKIIATGHKYTVTKNDAASHWKECLCGDKKDKAAHSFTWVIDQAASTSQKGSKHEECSLCGYKKAAVEIDMLTPEHTHSFGDNWEKDDVNHWKLCDCGEKTELAVHTFDAGVVTKEASKTEEGIKTYTCTICAATKTEAIEKLSEDNKKPGFEKTKLYLNKGDKRSSGFNNPTGKKVTYKSSDTKVVSVDKKGKLTAKKKGKATITATVNKKSYKCTVNVYEPVLKGASVVKKGKSITLKVDGGYGKATKWTSSKKNVATVDQKGKVKGKKKGTTIISVISNGKTLSKKITVK